MIFKINFLIQYIQAQIWDKFKNDETFNKLINVLLFDLSGTCKCISFISLPKPISAKSLTNSANPGLPASLGWLIRITTVCLLTMFA